MASSVAADVDYSVVPGGRLLYGLIRKNDLNEIRSVMDPLPIRTRQSIVCQKVKNKSLLGYACELGLTNIVKYLLDECGADISERYQFDNTWLSPLRVSINYLDGATFSLLLQRGAVAADVYEAIRCVKYVSRKKYFDVLSILRKYIDEIKSIQFVYDLRDLLAYLEDMSLNDVKPFLSAVAAGNIDKMKTCLPYCIDPKATNDFEENALCIAILNEKNNAAQFLLNYKIFSLKDYARALEMCGAKFIVLELRLDKGMQCWRKAVRIRTQHSFGVSDEFQSVPTDSGLKLSCEELDTLENTPTKLHAHALLVFRHLLSPTSQILTNTFLRVAQHPNTQKDFVRTIKLLCGLVELDFFPVVGSDSPDRMAIDAFEKLLRSHLECDSSNKDELLTKLKNLVDFMEECDWKLLLKRRNKFPSVIYKRLLQRVLHFLTALSELDLSDVDKELQEDAISDIMKRHSKPYHTTLLHLSIEDQVEYSVIFLIVGCSNVACTDKYGNTPLHAAASLPADYPHFSRLVNLLRVLGGNIDARNRSARKPYSVYRCIGTFKMESDSLFNTMASGMEVAVNKVVVPGGRLCYFLITKNNLREIRLILDAFTLCTRQSIVCQKVDKKTLLGYACELGFTNIVKYLLDECGADISERYKSDKIWLSPLRVSINNLDGATFSLLLQRGAVAADIYEAIRCVQYVSKNKYSYVLSILRKYIDEVKSIQFVDDLRGLFAYLDDKSLNNVKPFLSAVAAGNIDEMKTCLPYCIDPKATNDLEENALCIAILNENNAVNFLLNYKIFSLKDYVRALEICGAKFILLELRLDKGLQCWRKAVSIRTEHSLGVSEEFQNELPTDLGLKLSFGDLATLENTPTEIYVLALQVFRRLLSPTSQILTNTFLLVAEHPNIQKDFVRTIKLLCGLVELDFFPLIGSDSPKSMAKKIFKRLICIHLECDSSNKDKLLNKLKNLVDFMKEFDWKLLLKRRNKFPSFIYKRLLKRVLYFLTVLSELDLSDVDKELQRSVISDVMKWHSKPYPTTLLHLSIKKMAEYSVICFIISCSDNVNCTDKKGNTPMNAAASLPADYPHFIRLVGLLKVSGGNIYARNRSGETPYNMLQSKGIL